MRKIIIFSAVLYLFLLVPASITRAQTVNSQKGLTTIEFTQSAGKVRIYLPSDMHSGELVSGTANYVPAGRNAKQIENNRKELVSKTVSFNGTAITIDPASKHFQLLVPQNDPSGNKIYLSGSTELITPQYSNEKKTTKQSCIIPTHALAGDPFKITGPFDGNAANTEMRLGGDLLPVLAESTSSLIISYPNAGGVKTASVKEPMHPECSGTISGVVLSASAGKKNLVSGEQTYLSIDIKGLENFPGIATLTINNHSASTVALLPSNNIVIPLPSDSLSNGNFTRSFVIQGLRSGDFTMAVDLDLPEQADHPPTQPQPTDPIGGQCPKCNCSCTASIINGGTKDGVITYSVEIGGGCSGQWGSPPCQPCTNARIILWQVSFSADKPIELIGGNGGTSFQFKNPHGGHYTVTVKITDRCSDGTECTCTASISVGPPTTTEKKCPGCQCECGVKITPLDKQGDLWAYLAIVNAVCSGDFGETLPCKKCEPVKYDYVWRITDGDGKVVEIKGEPKGMVLVLKTLKKGKFRIHVLVTVTCSDGKTCKCEAFFDDEVPDDGCILTWKKLDLPKMKGGLDPSCMKPDPIRRDDFIALKATGEDEDHLQFYCTSIDCDDKSSAKFLKLSSMVRFEWKMDEEGPVDKGHFVKLGCWPASGRDAIGNQVIFQPPVLPLPKVKGAKDTSVVTTIILSVIDDNPTQPIDKEIHRKIRIYTKRTVANPDFYEVAIEQDKPDEDDAPKFSTADGNCEVIIEKWKDVTPLNKPIIKLPAGAGLINNNKLLSGEWIQLEANEQVETDFLWVHCNSKNKCKLIRDFKEPFADALEWEWTITAGDGVFVGSKGKADKGRFVIYEAPKKITEPMEVTIMVRVYNPSPKFDESNPGLTSSITLTIYPAGIKLDYPPAGWLPDADKPAILKSYLVYKINNAWQPAFEHNCRIHFFELLDVSNEPGTCLNSPARLSARTCRDFKLKTENGHEVLLDNDSSRIAACDKKGYFMQARTVAPLREYSVNVHAEDYGASGFLRSFANINKGGDINIAGQLPYYHPVQVQIEDVSHPERERTNGGRPKRIVYPDNRVNMPKDIDENRIPDEGWIVGNDRFIDWPPDVAIADTDNEPVGDGWLGDGLTYFEEYRGFMVNKPKLEHRRTAPSKKDLFIFNRNDLPVDEFSRITKIPVHEIREDQYDKLEQAYHDQAFGPYKKKVSNQRFINFNFGFAHDVNQKGLYLVREAINLKDGEIDNVLGYTPSKRDEKDDHAVPAPPNWNESVKVDRQKIWKHFNPTKLENDPVFQRKLKQVVAHELCHTLNVHHHGDNATRLVSGDPQCIMRYDNYRVRNEVPGIRLCDRVWGTEQAGRGNCASQLRISGRTIPNTTYGFPERK